MQGARQAPIKKDLVLVGAGHAHVQVLRRLIMQPLEGVRVTLVVDRHEAVYSGMVPGFVAGEYDRHALTIDALPLARRAGVRCIHAAATGVDPAARRVFVEGRPEIRYDVASLDVGSTVRATTLSGVLEHAIPTRPIGRFVERVDAQLAHGGADAPKRIAIVGGGAAGVELALCLEARLRAQEVGAEVSLVTNDDEPLGSATRAMQARVVRALERRGITVHAGVAVTAVQADRIDVREGASGATRSIETDAAVWATGAAPHAWIARSELPCDTAGFIEIEPTLLVAGTDNLFAAGDCAVMPSAPWVPRAGVYAVRAGPYLDANLRAALEGRALREYRPQRDFLALLNAGDGTAIGGKWGYAAEGAFVWRIKDRIDRAFMRRFQVLDAEGRPAADFPPPMPEPEPGDPEAMACGGCAAKLGPSPLADALARLPAPPEDASVRVGLAAADDAAAFATRGGDTVLASVDAFRAFVDDPWLVGRVATVNALSDIQAKGGVARHALALVTVPDEGPNRSGDTLHQVLAGVRSVLDPLDVSLVGGHSTLGPELHVGLSVTGELPEGEGWIGLDGLREGDALVLTKPIGTGILLAADMRGLAPSRWIEPTHASMQQENGAAIAIARRFAPTACSDVSGFGLAGHGLEMLRASGCAAELEAAALPLLPGALQLAHDGTRSTYHEQNAVVRAEVEANAGVDGRMPRPWRRSSRHD